MSSSREICEIKSKHCGYKLRNNTHHFSWIHETHLVLELMCKLKWDIPEMQSIDKILRTIVRTIFSTYFGTCQIMNHHPEWEPEMFGYVDRIIL